VVETVTQASIWLIVSTVFLLFFVVIIVIMFISGSLEVKREYCIRTALCWIM